MIDLLGLINLAIYLKLHQVNSENDLKLNLIEIYHLILHKIMFFVNKDLR